MSKKHLAIATLSSLIFGLNVVISKIGVNHFPPFLFSALRFLCVVPLVFFFPRPAVPFSVLCLISMAWGTLYIGGLNLSLSMGLSAGTAVLILQFGSLATMLSGYYLFSTQPKVSEIIGTLVALMGIFLESSILGFEYNMPALLIIAGAALSYSTGMIICKKIKVEAISVNIWVAVISFIPTLILSLLFEEDIVFTLYSANMQTWASVLFAGLVSTFLGGVLWIYVIRECSLPQVAPFRLLVPIFGVLFSVLLLNENFGLERVLASMLVVGGVAFCQFGHNLFSRFQKLPVAPTQESR